MSFGSSSRPHDRVQACARRGRLLTRAGDRGARRAGRRPGDGARDRRRVPQPARTDGRAGSGPRRARSAPSRTRFPWMPGGASLPLARLVLREPLFAESVPGHVVPGQLSGYGSTQEGLRALAAATGEIGVQEEPPGSNDGPRIAQYRAATAGAASTPGRWCAYFVSWAAAQAGVAARRLRPGLRRGLADPRLGRAHGPSRPGRRAAAAGRPDPLRLPARRHRRVGRPRRPADDRRGQPLGSRRAGRAERRRGHRLRPLLTPRKETLK